MRTPPEDAPRRRLDDVARRPAAGRLPTHAGRAPAPTPRVGPARAAPSAASPGSRDVLGWPGDRLPADPHAAAWASAGAGPARVPRLGWTPGPPPPDAHAAPLGRAAEPSSAEAHAAPLGSTPARSADGTTVGWDVDGALGRVRDGYVASHGRSPVDASIEPDLAQDAPTHRDADAPVVRWLLSWRVAAAAAVVVVLVAGTVAIRASTRAAGVAVDIPAPASSTPPASHGGTGEPPGSEPSTGSSSAVPPPVAVVVVHVVGAVGAPGVVRVPDGARVADALEAAGGATADADLSTLNLARLVVDGEQVVVLRAGEQAAGAAATGVADPAGAPGSSAGPGGIVDLNTADVAALDALPGIGPVLAERIVEHRAEHPFRTVDELADVRGIGPALLEDLRPLVRV